MSRMPIINDIIYIKRLNGSEPLSSYEENFLTNHLFLPNEQINNTKTSFFINILCKKGIMMLVNMKQGFNTPWTRTHTNKQNLYLNTIKRYNRISLKE